MLRSVEGKDRKREVALEELRGQAFPVAQENDERVAAVFPDVSPQELDRGHARLLHGGDGGGGAGGLLLVIGLVVGWRRRFRPGLRRSASGSSGWRSRVGVQRAASVAGRRRPSAPTDATDGAITVGMLADVGA